MRSTCTLVSYQTPSLSMLPLSKVADNIPKASTMFRGLINTLGLVQSAGFDGKFRAWGCPGLGRMSRAWGISKPWGKVGRAGRGIPLIARLLRDRWVIPELRLVWAVLQGSMNIVGVFTSASSQAMAATLCIGLSIHLRAQIGRLEHLRAMRSPAMTACHDRLP
jgi:hypothetical protein